MRRWEVLLWLFLAGLLVGVGFWWWSSRENPEPPPPLTSINPYARLTAGGSPLPSDAREDVVVEQQRLDGRIFTLSYDAETGSWQLEFFVENRQQILRYIAAEASFFYFNTYELLWDEVAPEILSEEIKALSDIEQYLLTDNQLDGFNRLAFESESVVCAQTPTVLCAVWQARNVINSEEVVIYVNKQSRKIDHIVSINPLDLGEGTVIANYTYEPVVIDSPPAERTRYLSDD